MAERIPRYFRGQAPPPPPPPPPSPGYTSAVPGQQPYAFGYSYGRGYQSSVVSASAVSTAPLHSTRQVKKNTAELETNLTNPKTEEKTGQKCLPAMTTTTKSEDSITMTKPPNVWTCKACNITLESEKALKGHRKSHVKCSDCPFEGSPKIVKAHYQAKHGKFSGSGFKTVTVAVPGCRVQKFKICVGNRPEDIQKWIEERKKRFPRSQAGTSKNNTNADSKTAATPSTEKKEESSATGLSSLLAGYGSSDDDSDNDENGENSNTTKSPATSLATTVQESDKGGIQNEDKTDTAKTTEIESNNQCIPTSPTGQKPKINRPCRFFFRNGSCRNGDNCRFSHDVQARNQNRSPASRAAQNKTSNSNARKRKRGGHTSSDTLLRRLLQNNMDRESTLSMQLLKFIVDNNFFLDKDPKTIEKRQRILNGRDEPM